MYKLVKHSAPGFSCDFPYEESVVEELRRMFCGDCLAEGGFSLGGLLSTGCGCEFSCVMPDEAPLTDAELLQLSYDRKAARRQKHSQARAA